MMTGNIKKNLQHFGDRLRKDHVSAYAATCAFFLMLSFIPLIMILLSIIGRTPLDETRVMNVLISVCPAGIRDYMSAIIDEVYTKSMAIMPLSVLILVWSASKVIFALTLSMNVIGKVQESRRWLYVRGRSILMILFLIAALIAVAFFNAQRIALTTSAETSFPFIRDVVQFFAPFEKLLGYFLLILIFLLIYKVLPDRKYKWSSQFPGALLVATVWEIVSYFLTLYYSHSPNFKSVYGSFTGMVLAMIWLYFCMYFLLIGAEINQIILENPEDNVIVNSIEEVKVNSAKKEETLRREIMEQKRQVTGEFLNKKEVEAVSNTADHDFDDETGIDLSLVRQGFYQNEDKMEGEDE